MEARPDTAMRKRGVRQCVIVMWIGAVVIQSAVPAIARGRAERTVRANCSMDRDGSNVTVLVTEPEPGKTLNGSPRWSYDGTMVAFDSIAPGTSWTASRVFVVGVSGPFKGQVADLGYGLTPSWSPDRTKITFMLHPGNPEDVRPGIWIMNSDGTERKWLAEGSIPHWSPRGDLIACTNGFGRNRQVYVIDVKTGERTQILEEGETTPSRLAWSPSGDRIAFILGHPNNEESLRIVKLCHPEKSSSTLWQHPGDGTYPPDLRWPAWSPDGKQMIVNMGPGLGTGRRLYSLSAEVPSAPIGIGDAGPGKDISEASWSPDGNRLVFVRPLSRRARSRASSGREEDTDSLRDKLRKMEEELKALWRQVTAEK